MRCPKCDFEAASEFNECTRCGVIVSKIKPKKPLEIDSSTNTSLVTCLTCSTQISVNAHCCPVCGEPRKKSKGGYLVASAVVAIIIGLTLLLLPTKKAGTLPPRATLLTNPDNKVTFDDLELTYQDVYWYQHQDARCIPTLKYKIHNKSNQNLKNLSVRAVYVQSDNSVFSQTTDHIPNLDPGLTTQCRRLSADTGYATMVGVRGKTMTLNLYGNLQGQEKLLSTLTLTDMQVKSRYEELKNSLCPVAGEE